MNTPSISEALSYISFSSINLYSVICVVLLSLLCFIVIKIVLAVISKILGNSRLEPSAKGFIRGFAKWLLWIIAIIIIAGRLGIETASLVALLGVVGLALSLSVQGLMTNLFSGLTILSVKPFSSGDYVDLEGASGTVKEVGMFYTTVATIDNKTVYIPNGQVVSSKIVNYTRQEKRRIDLTFSASYDNATEDVKAALLSAVDGDNRILDDPAPIFVGLLSYQDRYIQYVLRAWVKGTDYWDVYFSLNEKVREVFNQRDIKMNYNNININIAKD